MTKNIFQSILQQFKKGNHRLTSQRRAVIEAISSHKHEHMTIEDIYRYARGISPNISIPTVYRIADFLKQNNILRRLQTGDDHYFYEVIDCTGPAVHPHCICKKCGRTIDILDDDILRHIAVYQKSITVSYKFTVISSNMLYYGVCRECLADTK